MANVYSANMRSIGSLVVGTRPPPGRPTWPPPGRPPTTKHTFLVDGFQWSMVRLVSSEHKQRGEDRWHYRRYGRHT
jgi:hypothetical protein